MNYKTRKTLKHENAMLRLQCNSSAHILAAVTAERDALRVAGENSRLSATRAALRATEAENTCAALQDEIAQLKAKPRRKKTVAEELIN